MKTNLPIPLASWTLAAVVSIAGLHAQTPATVQMPTYEVTAPKFSSSLKEFYGKLDNIGGSNWVDAQGSALIQAIIWRHGYLRTHPSDEALVFVDRLPNGRVRAATTVFTEDGNLYANSYALGDKVRMGSLTAADIHDSAKVEQWLGGITGQYQTGGNVLLAYGRAGGGAGRGFGRQRFAFGGGSFGGSSGDLDIDIPSTEWGRGGPLQLSGEDTGQIVPTSMNMFYGGGGPFGLNALVRAEADDHFHEPASLMLDAIYRSMHDPNQAGMVPVSISPVQAQSSLVFDWAGIHYVYQPYVGTVGQPIPTNPVTGLPYLCVKDSGLLESVYFSATYLKANPAEKAVVVASDTPAAAFTAKGHVALFTPSLNHFAVTAENAAAINDPAVLQATVAKVKATLASLPIPAATPGHPRLQHVPERLLGDTPDSQMRRVYLAFLDAGIPVYLKTGDAPSLSFSWQGVNYIYGPDQQVRLASNVASNG